MWGHQTIQKKALGKATQKGYGVPLPRGTNSNESEFLENQTPISGASKADSPAVQKKDPSLFCTCRSPKTKKVKMDRDSFVICTRCKKEYV